MEMDDLQQGIYEYRNPYLHVIVDDSAKLLYSEWTRSPTSEEYREAASLFSKCLQQKDILYWIQDTTNLGEVSAENLKWVLDLLVPVATQSNLKKLARITHNEANMQLFRQMAQQAKKELQSTIEVRQFFSYREAAEWIEGISDDTEA